MDLKFVPLFHLIVLTSSMVAPKAPQVYEDVDETPLPTPKTSKPNQYQKFSFLEATHIDQRRWRYHQQQQADMLNRARNKQLKQRRNPNLRKREVQDQEDQDSIYFVPEDSVNYGLNHAENLKLLHESFGETQQQEKNIQALSALIGKTPTVQLEGLKQLLSPADHKPIIEHVVDVTNPHSHPNIKVEPAPPEYQEAVAQVHALQADAQRKLKEQSLLNRARIEKQLSAVAEAQAQKIAEQQALVLAQVQAEKAVLEKLQAQAFYRQTQATENAQAQALHGQIRPVLQFQPLVIQQKVVENSKNIYDESKDDLQYAAQYAFGYRVRDHQSGNSFGHEEVHDGKTAKGQYHVLLPDGRLQNVQYWADETGFHAKVTYDKVAQH